MRYPARRHPLWFERPVGRIMFVRELASLGKVDVVKDLRYPGGFSIEFYLQPQGVPQEKRVKISFSRGRPFDPHVQADGPTDSPHRYPNGDLCMWYPSDPPERRWNLKQGSAALVADISVHLLKEEWFRQRGEWVGDEIIHAPLSNQDGVDRVGMCGS